VSTHPSFNFQRSRSLVLGAIALGVAILPAYGAAIQAVRHTSNAATTTITVELDKPSHPRREVLDNPPRVLIDLAETKLHLPGRGTRIFAVNDGVVRQIRVAQYTPKTARIVLDLERPAKVEIAELRRPYRLKIDVRARHDAAPAVERTPPAVAPKPAPPAVSVQPPSAAAAQPAPQEQPLAAEPSAPAPVASTGDTKVERIGEASPAGPATSPAKSGGSSLTRALGLKLARVVIDAGHGGHDEGTRGPTGLLEKELTLDIAQRLGALIEQRLGSQVVYTRTSDVYVGLEERTAIANREGADLFLSIHANSSPLKNISGSDVYYLSFTTSKSAMEVASRENAATNKPMHELQELLKKIALNDKVTESQLFAARVERELYSTWNKMSGTTRNRGVKKAPFVVLIGAGMPSVLAEIGFVSNPRDEALLKRPEQRQRIAEALFRGVSGYASTLSRVEPAKAKR
jgi:N-acetylmuramoyl-L-alanine amidase